MMVDVTETLPPLPPMAPPSGVAVLEAAAEAVRGLGQTLWAARSAPELVSTVVACERLRSVLDAVELAVIGEVAATNASASTGWASAKDFVTAVSGERKGAGRRLVALARAVSTDRAATGRALVDGVISRTQAEVIVAAVDRLPVDPQLRDAAEQVLIEQAVDHDATDLTRVGRHVAARLDPDGEDRRDERALARAERAAHHGRFLSLREDGLGGVRVQGRGTVEDAEWIRSALLPLAAPDPAGHAGGCGGDPARPATSCGVADCAHDGRDPREHGTRLWDALVEACRRLTGTDTLPQAHGMTPRVAVSIGHDALATGLGEGLLEGGGSLSAAAVRRLACDAEILPVVLGSRSQILDVGRSSRLVTAAIWLALVLRDRHCAFPGCTRPPIACDAHHLVHWVEGGPTRLDNLVLLCRTHHTMIHTTPWQVRLNPDDRRPEFLPPARLDPHRRPRRRQPLRE
jgi:hypothetical protein